MKKISLKGFKIHGSTTVYGEVSEGLMRVIKILDELPFEELLISRELSSRAGLSYQYFSGEMATPALADYRIRYEQRILWGSKATIKELKRVNKARS